MVISDFDLIRTDSVHRKHIRYWSLIRILNCPVRIPDSASSRLPGRMRKSANADTEFSWSRSSGGDLPNCLRARLAGRLTIPAVEDVFGTGISKGDDHIHRIAWLSCYDNPHSGCCWLNLRAADHSCGCLYPDFSGQFRHSDYVPHRPDTCGFKVFTGRFFIRPLCCDQVAISFDDDVLLALSHAFKNFARGAPRFGRGDAMWFTHVPLSWRFEVVLHSSLVCYLRFRRFPTDWPVNIERSGRKRTRFSRARGELSGERDDKGWLSRAWFRFATSPRGTRLAIPAPRPPVTSTALSLLAQLARKCRTVGDIGAALPQSNQAQSGAGDAL